jgi:hypothetical protein
MTTEQEQAIKGWLKATRAARHCMGMSSGMRSFQRLRRAERDTETRCRELGVTQAMLSSFKEG